MVVFLEGLSLRSRALRFFSAATDLGGQARRAVNVDGADAYGLIATAGSAGEIVGHAGYVREDDTAAEVAFAIAEAYQGHGLATTLLAHLAAHARAHDIESFTAEVLPENHRMIDVFRESGFPVEVSSGLDIVSVRLPTELGDEGWERFHDRERSASVAAVQRVLAPRSVAVIGASRRRGTVGGEILHNLVAGGFEGIVYPVNPSAQRGAVDAGLSVGLRAARAGRPRGHRRAGGGGDRRRARLRRRRRARARRDLGRLRRDRARRRRPPARARRGLPRARHAPRRAQLPRRAQHRGRRASERDLHAARPGRRPRRVPVPERRPGDRDRRRRQPPAPRAVGVRVGRQQGRPVGQRLPAVLGAGPGHRRHPHVPRVLRQRPQVRPDRPPRRAHEADRRREERSLGGRRPRDLLAYGCAAGGLGRQRRRAVPAGRCHPHRHARRAVRRGRPALVPAGAALEPRRDHHERGRPRDPVRRRLRDERPTGGRAAGAPARAAAPLPARRGVARRPRRHDRDGERRGLPPCDRVRRPLRRGRCDHRDLHPAARHRGGRRRRRRSPGRRRAFPPR